jgi:TonB family protein
MTACSRIFIASVITAATAMLAMPAALGAEPEPAAAALTPPKLVGFAEAEYPAQATPSTVPVEVELELLISAEGQVTEAKATSPIASPFEVAAMVAARKFTFEPALRGDKPIPARIRYRYVFAPPPPPAPTTGVLEGRVLTQDERPVVGAKLEISEGELARTAITGADGTFRLDELPAGAYRVTIAAAELLGFSGEETVTAGEATSLTVRLAPTVSKKAQEASEALEFGATATVQAPPREVTKRTLPAEELNRVAGTRGDALRAIELMPGVARPPVGMGLVIIRGSAPTDSEVYLEGAAVPRLYHFGGLTSFVQGRLLDRIDMYPGNFSARFGRKLGGVVDVAVRDPKSDGLHAMLDINVIDASALVEGPVTEKLSVAAAFRRSYIDAWFGPLANSADLAVSAAPVYYDYQAMATWRPREQDKVRVMFYGSTDNFKMILKKPLDGDAAIRGNMKMSTGFHRMQVQWLHQYGERVEQEISVTSGPLLSDQGIGEALKLDIKGCETTARAEWRIRLGERVRLLAGVDSVFTYGDIEFTGPQLPAFEGDPSQNSPLAGRELRRLSYSAWIARPAGYVELSVQATKDWQVVAGLRADYYDEIERGTLDPRLVTRYQLRPGTTLKAGAGSFSQGPEIAQSLPEIGNPNLKPSHSQHYSLGMEQTWGPLAMSVEGFYKRLDNLIVSSQGTDVPVENGGRGRIWGAELSLKSRLGQRGFAFLSYTFSRSRRNDYGISWRRFDYDQPHILTLSGSYRLGYGFELGSTFRTISGNPYTPVVSRIYDADYDMYRPVYGQVNSARNPAFHQMDVRLERVWKRSWGSVAAYLDVQNAYNRRNPEGRFYNYDYTRDRTVPGLPIIPSLGVRGEL